MAADIRSFMAGVALSGAVAGGAVVAQSSYEAPVASSVQLFAANDGECRAFAQVPVVVSGEKEAIRNANVELVVPCDNFARSLDGAKMVSAGAWPEGAPALPFEKYEPKIVGAPFTVTPN